MLSDLLQARKTQGVEEKEPKPRKRLTLKERKEKIKKLFSREMVDQLEEDGKLFMSLASFFGLLLIFLFELLWKGISSLKLWRSKAKQLESAMGKRWGAKLEQVVNKLESKRGGVKRSFLIAMAFRNMKMKMTRSYVTVGGMALGIGAIVFLVSLGYGLQELVVGRVARLEELKMADVTLSSSGSLVLDNDSLSRISEIKKIEKVMPVVSLVGRVNFGGGVGESVVYGVTSDYLKAAGLQKVKGEWFESSELALNQSERGVVAGAAVDWEVEPASYLRTRRKVSFNIEEDAWLRVRSEPNTDSEVIGYLKRVPDGFDGVELWGESFDGDKRGVQGETQSGEKLGLWVQAPYPLWEKVGVNEYEKVVDAYNVQEWREGYIAEWGVIIDEENSRVFDSVYGEKKVLGEATASAQVEQLEQSEEASISAVVVGVDEQGVEWVEIDDASSSAKKAEINQISAAEVKQRKAVVNSAFLKLLGVGEKDSLGQAVGVKFVILSSLKPDVEGSAETEEIEYEIVAVIEDGDTPIMYVPFEDIKALGVSRYSQAKIEVSDTGSLAGVREQIDTMGYTTSSVADTVAQIDQLFGSLRMVLAVFGLVALAVASLGMFNTLTVSLMERTREVGVMKAMGMKSYEVRELFLAEAMVMGILGGVFGVLMGILAGKLLSLILSIFSLAKGVGFVDISYVPIGFIIFVLVLSFIVGVVTGIYPARRATRISALDALRYE